MDREVVWLDGAKDDVRQLLAYIAQDSPANARNYVDLIEKAGNGLATFPRRGRQYDTRYRVLVVRNHLLLYMVDDAEMRVRIVRVVDGRRDMQALLDEDILPSHR